MIQTAAVGFPRIGRKRELKFAQEGYWKGKKSLQNLLDTATMIEREAFALQEKKNISHLASTTMSLYDHVLDMSVLLGVVPERFQQETFSTTYDLVFAMARGTKEHTACEMTKWFNTNYHYLVPELDSPLVAQDFSCLDDRLMVAKDTKASHRPVLLGFLTYLLLGKGKQRSLTELEALLLPRYLEVVQKLVDAGVSWIQIDEPVLVMERSVDELALCNRVLHAIKARFPGINIFLQTYFESLLPNYDTVGQFPVEGIGMDFAVNDENMALLEEKGFPSDKVLGLGLIDGRNVWRSNLADKIQLIERVLKVVPEYHVVLQPSCSLQFVPVSLELEEKLDVDVKPWLAFAEEKLEELRLLQVYFNEGKQKVVAELDENKKILDGRKTSSKIFRKAVRQRVDEVEGEDFFRKVPFAERVRVQQERLQLPVLPTTTIGSFPQTKELRTIRKQFRDGTITPADYAEKIQELIKECVVTQEEIGLDVLVHGEFERNDMVEYFGEHLEGFVFTSYGWVQSYGSRCVKPPIVYGDVSRPEPITTEIIKYAASCTEKPMKGMLTGPVTILGWSFVRDDQPLETTTLQIALALRDEVLDLEAAGIPIIQIDEAALRERLPLRKDKQQGYLDWAIRSFRATCSAVRTETQIHTHMCYSYFNDIIAAIAAMDADCISIENSRSDMELLEVFHNFNYKNAIGLGVYDIHSPRVPSVEEMKRVINASLQVIDREQFWVNPDCGLKTRNWEEVTPSLKNMVAAAKACR